VYFIQIVVDTKVKLLRILDPGLLKMPSAIYSLEHMPTVTKKYPNVKKPLSTTTTALNDPGHDTTTEPCKKPSHPEMIGDVESGGYNVSSFETMRREQISCGSSDMPLDFPGPPFLLMTKLIL
jgi:hypothetical protein